MNLFLAKTKDEQSIVSHTEDLLFYFDAFKKSVEGICSPKLIELVRLSVLYHDIGKVNRRFQNKLYEKLGKPLLTLEIEVEEVPHGYLSPAFMDLEALDKAYSEGSVDILLTAVMYHHARQPLDNLIKKTIKQLIKLEFTEDFDKFTGLPLSYLNDQATVKYLKRGDNILSECVFSQGRLNEGIRDYVFLKGTLNKLDYLASGFGQSSVYNYPLKDKESQLYLDELVVNTIAKQGFDLRTIQSDLYENRSKSGLVIASTGMGKTEAALLWLSDKKGIFTLPLKVSIDSIYRRVKNSYGYSGVELVHSSMEDIYLQEQDALLDHKTRMDEAKLFLAPLTITTIDQVFKFVFLYNGHELMLSTLMHAKVVIDEIQMYDSQLIACLVYGIKMIYHFGGQFLVMTATLPYYIKELLIEQGVPVHELFVATYLLDNNLCARRHLLALTGESLDIERIIDQGKDFKVLVIVNTVKKAQEVYKLLSGRTTVKLLHSNFIRKDRRLLEEKIQAFTNDETYEGQKGIWISTQIVEASLDIDFDILHTEMCGIDSFIQRMGRVYRRRYELTQDMANVYVANTKNTGVGKIIDIDMYESSYKVLRAYEGTWITEEDKQQMMADVFDENKHPNMKKFKNRVQNKIKYFENLKLYEVNKKEISTMFRDIDTVTCIPFNQYQHLVQTGQLAEIEETYLKSKNHLERILAKNLLLDHTLSVRYNSKGWYPAEEDILQTFNIYISDRKYDFNSGDYSGEGLTLELESDDVFL